MTASDISTTQTTINGNSTVETFKSSQPKVF